MFEFRHLYCAHAKLHAPFPFNGLLVSINFLLEFELAFDVDGQQLLLVFFFVVFIYTSFEC